MPTDKSFQTIPVTISTQDLFKAFLEANFVDERLSMLPPEQPVTIEEHFTRIFEYELTQVPPYQNAGDALNALSACPDPTETMDEWIEKLEDVTIAVQMLRRHWREVQATYELNVVRHDFMELLETFNDQTGVDIAELIENAVFLVEAKQDEEDCEIENSTHRAAIMRFKGEEISTLDRTYGTAAELVLKKLKSV